MNLLTWLAGAFIASFAWGLAYYNLVQKLRKEEASHKETVAELREKRAEVIKYIGQQLTVISAQDETVVIPAITSLRKALATANEGKTPMDQALALLVALIPFSFNETALNRVRSKLGTVQRFTMEGSELDKRPIILDWVVENGKGVSFSLSWEGLARRISLYVPFS